MNKRKIIVGAIILGLAIVGARMKGLSVNDLLDLAKQEIAQSQADTKALRSGEYTDRYARKIREEAANQTATRFVGDDIDSQLNRELAEERKRMLEQRAAAMQKLTTEMLSGDVESLKRQVEKQGRQRQAGELP
jgi:hypothetical protein